MARTRYIRPEFFQSDQLAECSFEARLLFAGLWTMADREGIVELRTKKIKSSVFPHDDVNVAKLIQELCNCTKQAEFDFDDTEETTEYNPSDTLLVPYEANNKTFLWIPNFLKWQKIYGNEPKSTYPSFTKVFPRWYSVALNLNSNSIQTSIKPKSKLKHHEDVDKSVDDVDKSEDAESVEEIKYMFAKKLNEEEEEIFSSWQQMWDLEIIKAGIQKGASFFEKKEGKNQIPRHINFYEKFIKNEFRSTIPTSASSHLLTPGMRAAMGKE